MSTGKGNEHIAGQRAATGGPQGNLAKARRAPGLTRRTFVQIGGVAACTALLPSAGLLGGCSAEDITQTLDDLGVKSTLDATFRNERTYTDSWGRERTIPTVDALERVYFTSALAMTFVFSLRPDLMGGSSIQFTAKELEYLPSYITDLPYLGSLSAGGEIDREGLLKQDIQLVIDCSGIALSASDVSVAQNLEDQTGIPVLCIDGSFEKIAEAYRMLGEILGAEERAEEIAQYLEQVYNDVTAAVADIPADERVRLYYAEGPLGLQTEPDESMHALTFSVAGANNVAACEVTQGLGMTNVNLESVMVWDPEVIVAWDDVVRGGADEIIRTDEKWQHITAVANGRVYTMPNAPFAWCDRPPGMNRFLGIQWVANMLYPERYDVDMLEETKAFYSRMYWIDITDEQALDLLGNSYPPYGRQQ